MPPKSRQQISTANALAVSNKNKAAAKAILGKHALNILCICCIDIILYSNIVYYTMYIVIYI